MSPAFEFAREHLQLTRRYFLQAAGASAALCGGLSLAEDRQTKGEVHPALQQALQELESYLTRPDDFRDVSRGKPLPHSLPEERKREAGLTPDSWRLEVVSDDEHPAKLRSPLSLEDDTALDWDGLMKLAREHAVRFPKIMTCNNLGCPLGMGIWEGVPLRHVVWMTEPTANVRRVFYHGFHNNDPKQMFRSSLPIGRVLEDPLGLPPVILCYKLNGQPLTPERGGPVRLVAPEAYGFKSVKWLQRVTLSNLSHANDTYAQQNNDIDSWLKTFAATLYVPDNAKAGQPIPLTGYAQVGISGLSRVQTWVYRADAPLPKGDRYLSQGDWRDAEILEPPTTWGGDLPDNQVPAGTMGFDSQTGRPKQWPLLLAKAHWATLRPPLPAGDYVLRCRSIDQNGVAQPLPRPFDKSGRVSIERMPLKVEA